MTASDSPEIAGGGPGARLVEAIGRARREGRIGIMTHVVLGYPSLDESRRIVETMARAGVDLIEVQIPFSDPTADGPVITEACQDALDGGARVADAFDLVAKAASPSAPPMLFMTYVNIAFAYRSRANGGESVPGFVRDAARAGASGLIIPDLPPERREEGYVAACRGEGIHPVFVISPNITERRLALIRENASGLVYSTSRTGTTGREMELAWDELRGFLARARAVLEVPIAVGFSITSREHVERLEGHADVAVIGSHLLRAHKRGGLSALEDELGKLLGR
ncbi:MAG TPA: tryptophan synthase subunit alpha [Planctomycetota bacterium]|nr:tryptophan synthase subunit alpha [Planctomycetota bacterium]